MKDMETIGIPQMVVIGAPMGGGTGSGGGSGTGGAVDSVNGKTGEVVLDATDVGAATAAQVQSVADDVAINTQDIATLQAAYEGLTQSDIVPLDTLPASGEANTIYRVAGTDSYSDYMWDGSDFVLMATYSNMSGDGVYDISANTSSAAYDNLSSALGNGGANVPSGIRNGGMSIKYLENIYADYDVIVTEGLATEPTGTLLLSASSVTSGMYKASQLDDFSTLPESVGASETYYIAVTEDETTTYTSWVITKVTSDSTKYVQYRLMSSAFSADAADWQGVDEEPKDNSHNLLESGCVQSVLDVEESSVVLEQIDFSKLTNISGYMATYNQVITNTSKDRVVLFPLKAGETLFYDVTVNGSNQGFLGKYVSNSNCTVLKLGTGQREKGTYTAAENMTLAISFNSTTSPVFRKSNKKYGASRILLEMQDEIDSANAGLSVLDIEETKTDGFKSIDYTIIEGKYVDVANNTYKTSSYYNCTDWVFLKAGTVIKVKATNGSTANIATLAKKNPYYNVTKLWAVLWNTQNDTVITIDEDAYYAASWNKGTEFTFAKKAKVIEASSAFVDKINDELYYSASDDFSSGCVDGKYIGGNGTEVTNSSSAYKVFENIQAGTKIKCTVYTHPSVPVILLMGTYETKWRPVVTTSVGYRVETWEYIATEDGKIAINLYSKNSSHIATFDCNYIKSNRKNIENILAKESSDDNNSLVQNIEYGFMFDKIAVIGDSLASGRVEGIVGQPDAAGSDYHSFSWLQLLAKRWRCSAAKNYSSAGETTASWISGWLPTMQADTQIYDAYFINLGTNNEPEGNQESSTTARNAFIERYNAIVDAVRTKAPNAAIFIMSTYQIRTCNEIIESIAEERMETDNGILYLDYANNAKYLRYSPDVNWRGHFSSTGYVYVASVVNQILNDAIWNSKTTEFWQQFAKYHNYVQ